MSNANASVRKKKHGYWQAQGLVELELSHFQSALEDSQTTVAAVDVPEENLS